MRKNDQQRSSDATRADQPAPAALLPADDGAVSQLEALLRELVALHDGMLALAARRREAMRRADTSGLARVVTEENLAVQAIAELEKRRMVIVGSLADRLASPDRQQTRMSWIAERVADPARSRLSALAERLRELLGQLRRENERARLAAAALASHMDGLMRSLAARLNHARTYGRRGSVDPGPRVVSALDVRS